MLAYVIRRMRRAGGIAHRDRDEHGHLRPLLRLPDRPGRVRLRQELLAGAEGADRGRRSATTTTLDRQWVEFAKGVFVGRDFPDDPELRETAPETDRRTAPPPAWATPASAPPRSPT